jgi:hypothetical protein
LPVDSGSSPPIILDSFTENISTYGLPVQSNQYYLLTSNLLGSNYAFAESNSQSFFVSPPSSQSSGHWQIFHENPVFLIRNHDSLEVLQLGSNE